MKNTPLLPVVLDKYDAVYKEWADVEMELINRFNYIFKQLGEVCGFTFTDWYEHHAAYNEWGDVRSLIEKHIINTSRVHFVGESHLAGYDARIFMKNKIMNVRHSIPKRWLFEDFEQELKIGSDTFKMKTKLLAAQARAKLSAQELSALGVK